MDEKPDSGAELGKKLGRAFKRAKPQAKRLAEQAGPLAARAGEDALKFAREHEDEGRQLAKKLIRTRLGPLGMMVDALASQDAAADPATAQPASRTCPACQVTNSLNSRFCNQCGAKLDS